jgi:dienelactone hydrolase
MATPTLTTHELPGVLGPIHIDVRAGGREMPRPAVVIVHGFKGFKDWGMFPPLADRLARAGFVAVSVNLSGAGVDTAGNFVFPERFGHDTISAALEDVERVLHALVAGTLEVAPPSSIGVLGHSRGGGVAILTAARDARVAALVTWAAIADVNRWRPEVVAEWRRTGRYDVVNARTGEVLPLYTDVLDDNEQNAGRLDILAAAGRITAPWLLVHGDADEAVPLAEGDRLAAVLRHPASRQEWITGGQHTFGARHPWAGSTPELERVFAASVAWFARYLT